MISISVPSVFSPEKRCSYLEDINHQFSQKKLSRVSEEELQAIKRGTLHLVTKLFLNIIILFTRNQNLLQLLNENKATEELFILYKKCSKLKFCGFYLLKTNGKVSFAATKAFIKAKRQHDNILHLESMASGKGELPGLHVSKSILRCLRTIAQVSRVQAPEFSPQAFCAMQKVVDHEGNNIFTQLRVLLQEKEALYKSLSALYHAQELLWNGSALSKTNKQKLHAIAKKQNLHVSPEVNKELLLQQLAIAVDFLEKKIERIDAALSCSAAGIKDHLAIFETSTDRLSQKFPPKILKKPLHVTMIGVEYAGLVKEGGLAEALEGLAVGMKKQHPKNQVRLIFPKFSVLPEKVLGEIAKTPPKKYRDSRGESFNVFTAEINGVECVFIDHPSFTLSQQKPSIYGPDEATTKIRFAKFSQLAADLLPQLSATDVIHLHDWHVAGVALKYKKDHLSEWSAGKTPPIVFTFHNNGRGAQGRLYQGAYNYDPVIRGLVQTGIATENTNVFVEVLKIADSITTVSKTFAVESQKIDLGEGVSFATREAAKQGKFFGVVNGSNLTRWDPEKDNQLKQWKDPGTNIPVDLTFGADSPDLVEKKKLCKAQLVKWVNKNFPQATFSETKPVVTFIGRFDSYQKGLDTFDEAIRSTLEHGGQFVCMGSSEDPQATKILDALSKKYAHASVLFIRDYKDPSGQFHYQQGSADRPGIGSLVRGATDFMFIPSRFEPCGLVQFEGWLFGSQAIGSRVGGLADTIIEKDPAMRNGFLFNKEKKGEVSTVIRTALETWGKYSAQQKKEFLSRIMKEGRKHSWTESVSGYTPVEQYRFVYENAKAMRHARAEKSEGTREIDLPCLLRKIGSQEPRSRENSLEDRYLRLLGKKGVQFEKIEAAYLSLDKRLRMQNPSPYTHDVRFKEYEQFGAHHSQSSTHFEVPAPNAKAVSVQLVDTGAVHPLQKKEDGSWSVDIEKIPVGAKYLFLIDGRAKTDPYGRGTCPGRTIGDPPSSVVQSSDPYQWGDHAWIAQRERGEATTKPMSIYELYPAAWRKRRGQYINYRDMAPQLVALCKKVGYTHIELMGLLDHSSDTSWGYRVSGFFSPPSRFGTMDDVKYLINYLHKHQIGVLMDFIPNHFSQDTYALDKFDGTDQFQTSKLKLFFSKRFPFRMWRVEFFNFQKKAVRDFLLSSAAYWIDEMHVDALRVDAVHPILLSDGVTYAHRFLRSLNAVVHKNFPGVLTIAEDYSGKPQITKPLYDDGFGFDMKWNIAWMKRCFHYFAHPFNKRQGLYGDLVQAVEADTAHAMVLAISHDEVKKDDYGPLSKIAHGLTPEQELANVRSFLSFMYTVPGKKLLFMGCDIAIDKVWEFFIGKNQGIDDGALTGPKAKLRKLLAELNKIYKNNRAFFEKDANGRDITWIEKNDPQKRVVAFRRTSADGSQSFACVHNFTDSEAKEFIISFPKPIGAKQGRPTIIFNSQAKKYGGSCQSEPTVELVQAAEKDVYAYMVHVPPLSTLIIRE